MQVTAQQARLICTTGLHFKVNIRALSEERSREYIGVFLQSDTTAAIL